MRLRFNDRISRAAALAAALLAPPGWGIEFQSALPQSKPQAQKLAPYVTSPQAIAEKMVEISGLKSGETLYDLGCGDGRILFAAAKQGAKAVGVEISSALAQKTQRAVETTGLQGQVQVIEGDMLSADVSRADVVALYLLTGANDLLRPKLEKELRPGARVVSLEFEIKGWKPVRVEKVEAHRHSYKIYLYETPRK